MKIELTRRQKTHNRRNKAKLAFAQLEAEIEVLTKTEQVALCGGINLGDFLITVNGDGSFSLINPDSANNYFNGGEIFYIWDGGGLVKGEWLDNVTTTGQIPSSEDIYGMLTSTPPSLGEPGYEDYWDAYYANLAAGSSPDGTGMTQADWDAYNALVAEVEMRNEALGWIQNAINNGTIGAYVWNDPYSMPVWDPYADPYNQGSDGPFLHDEDGNIVATPTGVTVPLGYSLSDGSTINLREVTLVTADGKSVIAYETIEVYNSAGQKLEGDIPAKYKANCFGYALGNGDYWFFDNPTTNGTNEDEVMNGGFAQMLSDNFIGSEVVEASTSLVILYDGYGSPIHAGVRNSDGSYYAKNGIGDPAAWFANYEDFVADYISASTPVFYKPK